MAKLIIIMMALSLTIMPLAVYGQSGQAALGSVPPVSQPLVPEGEFALKLVSALNLGTANNEAQAEDMLSSVGIAPKNGWIAGYPVTPIIIGELQNAVAAAADANKLRMTKDDALKAFQGLTTEFGLAVVTGSPGQYAENRAQPNPTVVNDYYYDEGPPVITYYPPPWDYYYLYAWVPYPFWWGGFFFTGFYCLHDFHRAVFVGGHHAWVTNHFTDPVSRQVSRIDPTNGRRTPETFRATNTSGNRGFNTSEARTGAASIFNRGVERSRSSHMNTSLSTGARHGNIGSPGSRGQSEGRVFTNPGNNVQSFPGRSNNWSQTSGKSFSTPNRSFSGSSSGGGSFTCTNCHGGSSSFGRSSGTSSGSFSGGSSIRGGGFSGGGRSAHGGGHGGSRGR